MEPSRTFSESWYRVSGQRLCLRPGVKVLRQNFRGERWMILENPFTNEFFRLRPAAYEFVARLRPDKTVQEVWQQCIERFPDEAPSQESVIQLLSQLYFANLLQYEFAEDSAQLFARYKRRRQRELGFNLLNIMFMRFPLFDPDRLLVRVLPVLGKLISAFGAVLWLAVVGTAVKLGVDHFDVLRQQSEGVLAQDNLVLLFLGMVLIKGIHEFGHALFCRKFGGEVHVMGVMLMIFTPMPYVDATSSWSFRNRWQRVLVGAAGMITELFFAALMMFVWVNTAPGVIHSLAYNMMFVASVSTLIFNLNPLMRFDGYYILSDLLEIPNLNQRALQQLRYLGEKFLFGVEKAESPATNSREAAWYALYGIASGIYRVFVFAGVLFMVADRFLIIGLVMAVVCLISWVTVPLVRFAKYLSNSPKLARVRPRAIAVSAGGVAVLLILLSVVPFPSGFRAPGVVVSTQQTQVANETAGAVAKLAAKSGDTVKRGQALLELKNAELEIQLAGTRAKFQEINARLLRARQNGSADIQPLTKLSESTQAQLVKLVADKDRLVVRAAHDGIWVAPGIEDYVGRYLNRGSNLGLLVNPASFEFLATVKQEDVDALFDRHISRAAVRLGGDAATAIAVKAWHVIPGEQRMLPSAALGWATGGDVPVVAEDNTGSRTVEPFFEVVAELDSSAPVALLTGRSGKIRFALPAEPLLPRWFRSLWQLLQKRYQV